MTQIPEQQDEFPDDSNRFPSPDAEFPDLTSGFPPLATIGGGGGGGGTSEVLVWETETDWENAVSSQGMVHDGLADHAGTTIAADGYGIGSLTDGLLLYYPFDEGSGTTATDSTELGRDGNIVGATYAGSGQVGSDALTLDGTDDYVGIDGDGDGTTDDAFAEDMTAGHAMSAFINIPNTSSRQVMFGGSGSVATWEWRIETDGTQEVVVFGTSNGKASSTSTVSTGVYEHVAYIYDATDDEFRFYLNGTLTDTVSRTGDFDETNSACRVGSSFDGNRDYEGNIDDFGVYHRPLSPIEIQALANRTETSPVPAEATL